MYEKSKQITIPILNELVGNDIIKLIMSFLIDYKIKWQKKHFKNTMIQIQFLNQFINNNNYIIAVKTWTKPSKDFDSSYYCVKTSLKQICLRTKSDQSNRNNLPIYIKKEVLQKIY